MVKPSTTMFEPLTLDTVPPEWTVKVTGRKTGTATPPLFTSRSHVPTNGAQDDALAVAMDPDTTAPTKSMARAIFFLNMILLLFCLPDVADAKFIDENFYTFTWYCT
ncbi:MAG: hypothetical protein HY268_30900 [Deltaproteobacteria bacterium]|nr:hypothetical protein [Deltaproteobacteria bacterium]